MGDKVTVSGKVLRVSDDQEFGSKGFHKREMIIETSEKYPQSLSIEFCNDDAAKAAEWNPGDEVTVSVNIRGREYNGRYYTSLRAWGDVEGSRPVPVPAQVLPHSTSYPVPVPPGDTGEATQTSDDELPF